MHRNHGTAVAILVSMLVAALAVAGGVNRRGSAQPTSQTTFGIESPAPGEIVSGIVTVKGFILDRRSVSAITLLIDGNAVHDADLNQARPDVRWKYPKYQGEPFPIEPGFRTSFLASNYSNGPHTLAIRVRLTNGDSMVIGERTVVVDNTRNQAPIGGLDSPRDPQAYGAHDQISGVFPIVGWALDNTGIRKRSTPPGCNPAIDENCYLLADIDVMVDNTVVGQAMYPLPRPDVANAYPDVVDAYNSGFTMHLDTTRYTNGFHTISVRAWDTQGASRVLAERRVWIENNYGSIGPFGAIDWPMANGHFFSTACSGTIPISGGEYQSEVHLDWVAGWVIDQNDNPLLEGIVDVELHFNGVPVKRTTVDCGRIPSTGPLAWQGRLVNCYGFPRPDVEYMYPQFLWDAKHSGYFFAVDTLYWLGRGVLRFENNILEVWARTKDPSRPPVLLDRRMIKVKCEPFDAPAFGDLERPRIMQDLRGTVLLRGWLIDYNLLTRLHVWVDGHLDGSIDEYSGKLHLYRPDIALRYPWLPVTQSRYSGFEYTLDTSKYVDGVHTLILEAEDRGGRRTMWVQRPVRFDNHN